MGVVAPREKKPLLVCSDPEQRRNHETPCKTFTDTGHYKDSNAAVTRAEFEPMISVILMLYLPCVLFAVIFILPSFTAPLLTHQLTTLH